MLDKDFTPPKYSLEHLEPSPVFKYSVESLRFTHFQKRTVEVNGEERQEVLSLFSRLTYFDKLEVLYQLSHQCWDIRLLGEYQGVEVALKVEKILLPMLSQILDAESYD